VGWGAKECAIRSRFLGLIYTTKTTRSKNYTSFNAQRWTSMSLLHCLANTLSTFEKTWETLMMWRESRSNLLENDWHGVILFSSTKTSNSRKASHVAGPCPHWLSREVNAPWAAPAWKQPSTAFGPPTSNWKSGRAREKNLPKRLFRLLKQT